MLKSLIFIPTCDILSYNDHKEYPFILFPTLVLKYNSEKLIKLDNKDLSTLFYTENNNENIKSEITINFSNIKKPRTLFLEENCNNNFIKNKKLSKIKKLLPFCKNINNLIINLIENEDLKWKLKIKKKYCKYPFIIDKIIKKYPKKLYNLDKIYCSTFNDSCIPHKINVTYFNGNDVNRTIKANTDTYRTLYFIKEKTSYNSVLDTDSDDELKNEYNCEYKYLDF